MWFINLRMTRAGSNSGAFCLSALGHAYRLGPISCSKFHFVPGFAFGIRVSVGESASADSHPLEFKKIERNAIYIWQLFNFDQIQVEAGRRLSGGSAFDQSGSNAASVGEIVSRNKCSVGLRTSRVSRSVARCRLEAAKFRIHSSRSDYDACRHFAVLLIRGIH